MAYSRRAVVGIGSALLLTATGSYQFARHQASAVAAHAPSAPAIVAAGVATAAAPIPASGRRSEDPVALPPLDTPVPQLVATLAAHAERGSTRAACRLAIELKRCETVERVTELASFVTEVRGAAGQDAARRMLDETETAAAACAGVTQAQRARAFRYQQIAFDGGGAALQRWFVESPALEFTDFVNHLDDWRAYRERALRYRDTALRRRDRRDLEQLVQIHAPPGQSVAPGKIRVRDDALYLALVDAARVNGVDLPSFSTAGADRVRRQLTADEQVRYRQLRATHARRWTGGAAPGKPRRVPGYFGQVGPELCEQA